MTDKKKLGRPKKGEIRPPKVRKERGDYGPRPDSWLSGPDEFRHSLYIPWLKAKAQANYRNEEWTLTFDEWFDMWKDDWHLRGRAAEDICMTRADCDGAWSAENTVLMTRREHLKIQGHMRGTPSYNIKHNRRIKKWQMKD
jgi:hypothetical protein